MRLPVLILILWCIVNLLIDWYIFRLLRSRLKNRVASNIQLVTSSIFAIGLIAIIFLPLRHLSDNMIRILMWIILVYVSIYIPKYIFVLFDLLSRVPRLWHKKRLKYISWIGLGLGLIIFFTLWYGALVARNRLQVKNVSVEISGLPTSFNDFKIVQISDFHLGTFGSDTRLARKVVTCINNMQPDLIVFTGDMVNRKSSETEPFISTLSGLKAKYGVFSVLGNHDYGHYMGLNDSTLLRQNVEDLKKHEASMGWTVLTDDSRNIVSDQDTLVLIGVENIGSYPFYSHGNLLKTYPDLKNNKTKILLSHDPSHWVKEIADSEYNIALTLSGHTHGMQISVFGVSPGSIRYKTLSGLYHDKSDTHQLYVNIGLGTVGFPVRIGATPEITLITLKAKS